ncbi:MAG: GAF domain-containing protein, partial [Nitrospiraceae bacterium]|nr:GAF domain-containing protein [Nitrospiraceae bacterium]
MIQLIDIQSMSKALESLSAITGLNFSIYDDRENLLIAPFRQDPLLSRIKTSREGRQLYHDFLSRYLKLALRSANPLLIRGFTGQHHVFMPIRYKEAGLVALCEGFYTTREDFARFYAGSAEQFGLTGRPAADWLSELNFADSRTMGKHIGSIKPLLESILSSGYEKRQLSRRWQWSRTIITLAAGMGSGMKMEDMRQIITDTVIFLFGVDTAAVFSMKDGCFHPESAGGRSRGIVKNIRLSRQDYPVSEAIRSGGPVSAADGHKLRRSGFPEEIISMYLFPIGQQTDLSGFLGIFNCMLDHEILESISGLCKLSTCLLNARRQGDEYAIRRGGLDHISRTASRLFYHYRDLQALCDSIVDESARFVGAEKCSLMLPDENGDALMVISARGVNKWLMRDVRVRTGEGIAGKVLERGAPVLIDNEEKFGAFSVKPRPLFKTQSCLSLPLKIAGETIGILNLSDKSTGEPFTQSELSALSSFATEASILLKLNHCHRTSEQMRELSIT